MQNFHELEIDPFGGPDFDDDVLIWLDYIRRLVEGNMPKETTTDYENAFLRHYFDRLKKMPEIYGIDPTRLLNALLPIPQLQLYVHDPLEDDWSGRVEPTNNFRVDFGFWTGKKLIAVEIDGQDPEGYARDVRRDRLLRCAEVDVIYILNTEIEKHGARVISEILPHEITHEWRLKEAPKLPFIAF